MKDTKGGLGLDNLGNLSSLLEEDVNTGDGKPLNIDISLIDEDPEQPRMVFSKTTLKELAESIKTRGVKTPISVRVTDGERYMINHGARRLRASILAEKTTIPAYIDLDYSKADQIIENIHRDNLTSREIAEFIGRQISAGQKKGEIARDLGKSGSFVTQHHTLLNLPDELAELYNSGQCNDVTVIYEFAVAYKKNKDEVIAWIESNTGEWNRANIKLFKEYLAQQENPDNEEATGQDPESNNQLNLFKSEGFTTPQDDENQEEGSTVPQDDKDQEEGSITPQDDEDQEDGSTIPQDYEDQEDGSTIPQDYENQDLLVNGVIIISFEGRKGEILLTRVPSEEGYCWVEFDDGVKEINMSGVEFVSLIEG